MHLFRRGLRKDGLVWLTPPPRPPRVKARVGAAMEDEDVIAPSAVVGHALARRGALIYCSAVTAGVRPSLALEPSSSPSTD